MEDKIKELGLLLGKANKLFEEIQNTPTNNPSPNPQFEVEKWYLITTKGGFYGPYRWLVRFLEMDGQEIRGDFFDLSEGEKVSPGRNAKVCGLNQILESRPATPEEVKQALFKEIQRKYKEGDKVKTLMYGDGREFILSAADPIFYDAVLDRLQCGDCTVYQKGIWAEIIKEEVLMFGGNPVTIDGNKITCKGVTGTYEQLKRIYDWANPTVFKFGTQKLEKVEFEGGWKIDLTYKAVKVKVGCSWGTIEEIKAILEAVEKHKSKFGTIAGNNKN